MSNIRLGDTAPNFDAETTEGKINFYEYLGDYSLTHQIILRFVLQS